MAAIDRAQWLADARALLDFIEANPDLPVNANTGLSISYHPMPGGISDDDRKAAVDAVADLLGKRVTHPGPGSHYEVGISFGSAHYQAVAVLRDYRERYDAVQRLGEAALDAAERAVSA